MKTQLKNESGQIIVIMAIVIVVPGQVLQRWRLMWVWSIRTVVTIKMWQMLLHLLGHRQLRPAWMQTCYPRWCWDLEKQRFLV